MLVASIFVYKNIKCEFYFFAFCSDISVWDTREEGTIFLMACEKKNQSLIFSDDTNDGFIFSHLLMHIWGRAIHVLSCQRQKAIPYRSPCGINVAKYETAQKRRCYIRDSSNASLTSCRSKLLLASGNYVCDVRL